LKSLYLAALNSSVFLISALVFFKSNSLAANLDSKSASSAFNSALLLTQAAAAAYSVAV
jgi:hypothetical protein